MQITVHEFHDILKDPAKKGRALYLDVRTTSEHAAERIPDVYNLPLKDLESHIEEIKKYEEVYVHCQSGRRSDDAKQLLESYGVKVINVEGGASEWKSSGKEILKDGRMPIMQQVHAIAGSLVFVGSLLAFLLSPWFLILTGFVGAGLMFAGFSGHCMMAFVLAKMPWNKKAKAEPLPWQK